MSGSTTSFKALMCENIYLKKQLAGMQVKCKHLCHNSPLSSIQNSFNSFELNSPLPSGYSQFPLILSFYLGAPLHKQRKIFFLLFQQTQPDFSSQLINKN